MERLSDEIINKYIAEMRVVVDVHKCDAMYRDNMLALIELKQYRDIGLTPEQIMELKARDTEKAPVDIDEEFDMYVCPSCNMAIGAMGDREEHKFCLNCGQKLNWEE